MSFELFRAPITPASPAGLTTEELKLYLGVGRNNVASIARRFGIEKLHGIYPERVVWRQLFGVGPEDEAAQAALREPLVDINWVSRATGVPPSTIRDHLRSKQWKHDFGVQLGDQRAKASPRLRRWVPALIRNRVRGAPPPTFADVAPLPVTPDGASAHPAFSAENSDHRPSEDLFAALFSEPAAASR